MSLTAKKRPSQVHSKIKAHHHRQTKSYLKTYWPYIPIISIIGIGLIINYLWHTSHQQVPIKLTNYTYYNILESSIGVIALAIFLLRHAFAWHKVFIKEEVFVAKHPFLDISLVALATMGLLLAHNGINII